MIKVAFIFPGQGTQFIGMGKEFYEISPQGRAVFDEADQMIPGLSGVIFNGPAEKLTSTRYCQPAIFTFSIAALRTFKAHPKSSNAVPQFACGLSLGEYSALAASGALSFEETLRLIERRSFFMEEAAHAEKGSMAAVIGLEKEKLIEICRRTGAEVANFNSLEQVVITGAKEKVARASALMQEAGAKRVIPLDVSGAFHSSLMWPAVRLFAEELKKVNFSPPNFPVISNVDGIPTSDPAQIRRNLARQMTSSVQWVDTILFMAAEGVRTFLEIGPGNVLKGLIRKIDPSLHVYNIRNPEDIQQLPF